MLVLDANNRGSLEARRLRQTLELEAGDLVCLSKNS